MGATNFGVVESSWLPKWAADNGHDLDAVTTSNNVALERGLTAWMMRDLKERFPEEFPRPINEHPPNRQAFRTHEFDEFFAKLDAREERPGKLPERLAMARKPEPKPIPAPPAQVPRPRQALPDPHSTAGRLLAGNARERERVERMTGELNLLLLDVKTRVELILDIDQGNGQSARDARHTEIQAVEAQIEVLKQQLRDLRSADRKANAFTEADLPRLRAELEDVQEDARLLRESIWGRRAEITRRHRKIVATFGEIDEREMPQIKETSETDRLLREIAAGHLVTLAGAAMRLGGVEVQKLRDGKKRWSDFPEPVGVHPNKTSGDLYEFRPIETTAKKHGLVYTDDEVPAL